MTAPSRMSKGELRETLLLKGFKVDEVSGLKREKMIELICDDVNSVLETAVVQEDNDTTIVEQDDNTEEESVEMDSQNPGWTQHVLGMFTDDELEGKNPRVEGLRRVAEEVIGEIIEEGCDLVAPPTQDNEMRACVKAWIVFVDVDTGIKKRYEALADAYSGNCLNEFGSYITAMADTRAKGRCLRNALKLKRVVAAEEVDPSLVAFNEGNKSDPADPSQLTAIRIVSNRIDKSISDVLTETKIVAETELWTNASNEEIDLSFLKKGQAQKILQVLNEMSITKNSKEKQNVGK